MAAGTESSRLWSLIGHGPALALTDDEALRFVPRSKRKEDAKEAAMTAGDLIDEPREV